MEAYPASKLPDPQLAELVEYVLSLSAVRPKDLDAALAQKGATVFRDLSCDNCHEVEAGRTASAPVLLGRGSVEWIESVIKDSSQDHLFSNNAKMPKFGQKLTEDQIHQLAIMLYNKQPYAAPAPLAAHK